MDWVIDWNKQCSDSSTEFAQIAGCNTLNFGKAVPALIDLLQHSDSKEVKELVSKALVQVAQASGK